MRAENVPIRWLMQSAGDIPGSDGWLSDGERAHILQLRTSKRRNDWRLGRWTAKRLLVSFLAETGRQAALSAVEVRARPDGSPAAVLDGEPLPVSISLSHSHGVGLCTVCAPEVALGCDLELVEPRAPEFLEDYFTAEEKAFVQQRAPEERALFATLIWSGKESALKALREGLRRDTRSVEVLPGSSDGEGGWRPLAVRCHGSPQIFHGWWRPHPPHILTIISVTGYSTPKLQPKCMPEQPGVSGLSSLSPKLRRLGRC